MNKTKNLKTKMVTRYVKYFTKELLQQATRNAESWDFNRQLSQEAMDALPDDCRYPVEMWFTHHHRHFEPAEEHIRAQVAMDAAPKGGVAFVDMPVEFWDRLPTHPVRIRKAKAKYMNAGSGYGRCGSIVGYNPIGDTAYYVSPEGFHRHRCPQCRHVWEHSDEMFDNVKAHTCAKCGCGGDFGELDERCWEHYCGPEAPSKPKHRAKPVAA